ncbi:MAG TPA: ribosome biogenesis protein [Candidatus Caldiarchaeum subterraneum]|uniref:Ribosome biogenesis protein Nop10 n=1 Tax=Caldiarchaeum subterraneum TaxID=311458 RepID=A0A832ZWM1_CALS0|nr:ribosome biogenesis protein [Candidatus Caldarchaeum subterraneum]
MARSRIRRCPVCRAYTLRETCSICGAATVNPHPPPFSPSNKYLDILLKIRRNMRENKPGKDINTPSSSI